MDTGSNDKVVNEHEPVGENKENEKTSSGLEQNVAALLCYLAWFITGIIFLLIEKENRFVRFHALQSIITSVVLLVINIVLSVIPIIGVMISLLLAPFTVGLWIFMMWKAYNGKWVKLPVIGDITDKQLNKIA